MHLFGYRFKRFKSCSLLPWRKPRNPYRSKRPSSSVFGRKWKRWKLICTLGLGRALISKRERLAQRAVSPFLQLGALAVMGIYIVFRLSYPNMKPYARLPRLLSGKDWLKQELCITTATRQWPAWQTQFLCYSRPVPFEFFWAHGLCNRFGSFSSMLPDSYYYFLKILCGRLVVDKIEAAGLLTG